MSKQDLIGDALAKHTTETGTTSQRVMYLGRGNGLGDIPTNDPVYPRSVWAHELNGQAVQVLLPDYPVIPLRNDPALENIAIIAGKPPSIDKFVMSLSGHLAGQQTLGANGVTPFENEHNQIASLTLGLQPANYIFASPDKSVSASGGQPIFRPQVLNDIPNGLISGQPLLAGSAAPAYGALNLAGGSSIVTGITPLLNGGSGADLSATGGAHKIVFQETLGGAFTVRVLASSDVPSGAGSPLSAKGDLYTFSTVNTRQPAGADYSVPIWDSSQTTGIIASSSATSALQLPAGTTLQQPVSPSAGMVRYNSNTGNFEFYTTAWRNYVRLDGDTMTGTLEVDVPTTTKQALILKTTDDNTTNNLFEGRSSAGVVKSSIGATGISTFLQLIINGTLSGVNNTGLILVNGSISGSNLHALDFSPVVTITSDSFMDGILSNPTVTINSAVTSNVVSALRANSFSITNNGTIGTVASGLYIDGEPSVSGTAATLTTAIYVATGKSVFLGKTGIGLTPTAQLHVLGLTNTQLLILKNNSGQTANMQEWQNNSGAILSSINSSGWFAVKMTGAPQASIDTAGSILARGFETPTSGKYGRLGYDTTNDTSEFLAFDSTGSAFKPFRIRASKIEFGQTSGAVTSTATGAFYSISSQNIIELRDSANSNIIRVKWDNNFNLTTTAFDSGTGGVLNALVVGHNTSAGASVAAGYGTGILVQGQDNNNANTNMFILESSYTTATDASYATKTIFSAYDKSGGKRNALQLTANGSRPIAYVFPGTQTTTLAALGGSIFDDFVDAGNSTTTETDAYSHSIAGNTFATNGDSLEWNIYGTSAGSATATTQLKVYFGGTVVADTGAIGITAADNWHIHVLVIRDSSTSVRVGVDIFFSGGFTFTASPFYATVTGLTLSSSQTFKITETRAGVGAATNDILAKLGKMAYLSAI